MLQSFGLAMHFLTLRKEIQQHIIKPNERRVFIMNYNDYDVLTAHEAMNYLGIGENSIYRLLKSGELGAFRIGRTWKIPIKELDKYIDESVTKNLKN